MTNELVPHFLVRDLRDSYLCYADVQEAEMLVSCIKREIVRYDHSILEIRYCSRKFRKRGTTCVLDALYTKYESINRPIDLLLKSSARAF